MSVNHKETIYIIGASGHGKVVADIARLNGYKNILFLDDDHTKTHCGGYPVVGSSAEAGDGDVIAAIGNSSVRRRFEEQYKGRLVTLIHPNAVIAKDVKIGTGAVIMAGAVINPGTKIGLGCIINTCASVDHDNMIGDYCHISVGVHLAGTVTIGSCTWIGVGATVSNNIDICEDCMIGAGAVVVRDITSPGTYVGVPAHQIKPSSKETGGVIPSHNFVPTFPENRGMVA